MAVGPTRPATGHPDWALELLDPNGRFRTRKPVRLVVDRDGHFAQFVLVLTGVVSTEEKLGVASEFDSHVRLSAAAIAAIDG